MTDWQKKWASLSFEDRQKQWTGFQRRFRQHHGRGEVRIWDIWLDDSFRVCTQYGQLGGALQHASYIGKAKNVGRANAITAEQDALAEARRDIRKKWDFEGYDEYIGEANIDHRNQDISVHALLTNLPGSFCLYKPENNLYDQKRLLEKANRGEVLYTLKRDGVAKWIIVDYYGNIQIYSRRSRPCSDTEGPEELADGTLDWSKAVPWAKRFPHIVEAVKALHLPPGSMMAVELVAPNGDDFRYVSGLTKGHTERALADMQRGGLPNIYWWDLPFCGGEDLVRTYTVGDRYSLIEQLWLQSNSAIVTKHIQPIQKLTFKSPEEAIEYAKANGLEGMVVVDPTSKYESKGWNLKGKPDRPKTCAKLKPKFEDDFVALWDPDGDHKYGTWGTGRHERGKTVTLPDSSQVVHGGVGSASLYQYDSKGSLVYICDCSSGMDYEFQSQLRKEDFPMVWQVEYTERTYVSDGEDTNALKFPVFLRKRDDKKLTECINERL